MSPQAKVLFIDSDSNMRQVYQDILTEEDLKLITAAPFSEAAELMEKQEFQIIYYERKSLHCEA